jgi:16S rRNA A1518/A1519 N6-dimethyltransferase RsmA/KsgA/DIM1 with predicted DNA glycosylase/AP lyase activity
MMWLLIGALIIVGCFCLVVLVGAPYLPTLKPQIAAALELANLQPGDRLIELGCGDGRVVLAAARQGLQVTGYELNPLLALLAWLRTLRYRRQVRIIWGDFWRSDWPPTDAIFTFLLTKYMKKLDNKIVQYNHKPVKLVSFAFQIPDKQATAEKSGVYLYTYR